MVCSIAQLVPKSRLSIFDHAAVLISFRSGQQGFADLALSLFLVSLLSTVIFSRKSTPCDSQCFCARTD